jgi:hypothetical protein
MYAIHQKQIELWANGSPENTHEVIKFVLATANRYFVAVPKVLAKYQSDPIHSGFSGMQLDSLGKLWVGRKMVYKTIQAKKSNPVELMRYVVGIQGLGIPKAGFVCQLLTGQVGCMDVWNMRDSSIMALLGVDSIKKSAFTISKETKEDTIVNKLTGYVGMCQKLGSEFLWNNWCTTLAAQYGKPTGFYPWKTAYEVSQFHVDACIR